VPSVQELGWWRFEEGAQWRAPEGKPLDLEEWADHPVVQIGIEDARAYADWLGHELPTETEWEYAARGGLDGKAFAWGDELAPNGKPLANHWQGLFPFTNDEADGFFGASPVGCFPPNGFGLYDMIGNVWELVDSPYTANRQPGATAMAGHSTIKGGSFLCAANYCQRYRPAGRQPQERDLSTNHIGFRTIYRGSPPE